MRVITAPHPTLRMTAKPVGAASPKVEQFLSKLGETLVNHTNPQGVGLAAPQVDKSIQIFSTYLPINESDDDNTPHRLRFFINPTITDHSKTRTFGPDKKNPILEGCLSIPGIYGPIPRFEWVTFSYLELHNNELHTKTEKFNAFAARVMLHEFDHLKGVLFTDYSLQHDLPIYQEKENSQDLIEIDKKHVEYL